MSLPCTKPTFHLTILLALCIPSGGQNSPEDYLAAHNAARAQVGVDQMTWNNTLASYAQSYAASRAGDCSLVHSAGPYGEDLATGTSDSFSGVDAVNMWVREKGYYDYNANACAPGEMCGHYTQVVWRSSAALGCGRTPCNAGGWYVVCSYSPRGNSVGQRPY